MSNQLSRDYASRFTRLILWGQRHSWLFPYGIRSAVKRILVSLRSAAHSESPVEDWSTPLIGRGSRPLAFPNAENSTIGAVIPSTSNGVCGQLFGADAPGICLRCLIVTPFLDAGGIDEFVAFLARQLPQWGIDATVMWTAVSLSKDHAHVGLLARALRSEGVSVIEATADECRLWLAANRPDVISAHAPPEWVLEAAQMSGIPVVETLHAVPTPIWTDWRKEPVRSRYVTSMVAVSELVRRQYLRGNPGYSDESIVTIPNAFNQSRRPSVDRANARAWLGLEDQFLFVSLARHVLQKNAYGLVTAFAEVARAHPRAHLLIAGRAEEDRQYTEQVRLLRETFPERNNIHLRNSTPHPSVLLAAADGFVLNSFFEGWPLASMEALSAGLPVVISEVGGAREQVGINGERGYVVPNALGDPELVTWRAAVRERFRPQVNKNAMVVAMTAVIRDQEYWAAIRPTLAEASKQRFSAKACAGQHAAVLRRAAANRRQLLRN
jgi:glycosyltransferase involved in cell wall biosynthesis